MALSALAEVLSQKLPLLPMGSREGGSIQHSAREGRETGTDHALYPIGDVASTFVVNERLLRAHCPGG